MTLAGFKAQNHPQQTGVRGALDEVDDRGTAPEYFDPWNERFGGFTLDAAAAAHNAKCEKFFTRADDGLAQQWAGERVWCNPPYSNLEDWVAKAWREWPTSRGIVMLLPANRVEQKWWQQHVEPYRDRPGSPLHVEFQPGRMRFIRPNAVIGPKGDRPPFGCALLIWDEPTPGQVALFNVQHTRHATDRENCDHGSYYVADDGARVCLVCGRAADREDRSRYGSA